MSQAISPIMVRRDTELRVLDKALDAASAGSDRSLFLVGEAGIGKSRLMLEAASLARRRGMLTLFGRAVPQRLRVAFRPIREALLGFARTCPFPDSSQLSAFRPVLA